MNPQILGKNEGLITAMHQLLLAIIAKCNNLAISESDMSSYAMLYFQWIE